MGEEMLMQYFTGDTSFPFFIQYGEHDEPLCLHRHRDFHELVMVFKGSAVHVVGQERYPIARGDVFVVHGETEHGYEETDGLRICNIMYHPRLLEGGLEDLGRVAGFQALFRLEPALVRSRRFESRLHLSVGELSLAEELVRSMIDEYPPEVSRSAPAHWRLPPARKSLLSLGAGRINPAGPADPGRRVRLAERAGCRTLIMAHFMELVVLLSRWYEALEPAPNESPLHIARAAAFIEEHYDESIDVDTVAAVACLSSRHFRRLFGESYGVSPMHYLLRVRLRAACALLANGERSITELALACGFSDANLFTRQFSRQLGVSPSEWRRQRRC